MIIYHYVELDFGSVFVLDVQGPGPWTVILLFHFLLRVSLLSSFVLLFPPNPLLFLQRLGIRERKLCHAISIS